jgi:hypothetical protein
LDAEFLLKEALKPNVAVRMSISPSFEKRRWAISMKINSTEKWGNWVEGSWGGWRRWPEERVRDMPGDKNALNTQVNPCWREIR